MYNITKFIITTDYVQYNKYDTVPFPLRKKSHFMLFAHILTAVTSSVFPFNFSTLTQISVLRILEVLTVKFLHRLVHVAYISTF